MGSGGSPKGTGIFASVKQKGFVEFVEHLHRLSQDRIRQSKDSEHQSRDRQRFGGHSRRFAGQGNVLPPRERRSSWYMPDLAQGLLVRSQDDQPTCDILDERKRMRHIQFAEPGHTLASHHRVEELFSHE